MDTERGVLNTGVYWGEKGRVEWEAKVGGPQEVRSSRLALPRGETPSLLKIQKLAWWYAPVVPATREAEAGELPEPRMRRLW